MSSDNPFRQGLEQVLYRRALRGYAKPMTKRCQLPIPRLPIAHRALLLL
jgi:hypothetical protein